MNLNDFNLMLALIEEAKDNPTEEEKKKRMENWKHTRQQMLVFSTIIIIATVLAILYLYSI